MGRLDGTVALVTGGTRGIGLAIAGRFSGENARVVVTGRDEAVGREAEAALGRERARFVPGDVAGATDCERMVAETVAAWGSLNVVVANAAIGTRTIGGTVDTLAPEQWERAYRINLGGVVETCRAALPHLRAAGGGSIVLISSVAALVGTEARPTHAYAAMKGALLALTRAMAVSYGPDKIRVNAIVPGLIRTRLTADLLADDQRTATAISYIPLRRVGEPEDIAHAAVYLAANESRFVTGATLVIDGGATIS